MRRFPLVALLLAAPVHAYAVWAMLTPRVSDEYRAFFLDRTAACHRPDPEPGRVDALPWRLAPGDLHERARCAAPLIQGWHRPERWGVWAEAKDAFLDLDLAETAVPESAALTLRVFAAGRGGRARSLAVSVNGGEAARLAVGDGADFVVELPLDGRAGPGRNRIGLHLDGVASPVELGLGADTRRLGVGLLLLSLR